MTKSLYTRTVIAFISISVISLMVSTFIGIGLFQKKVDNTGQKDMLVKSQEIVNIYEETNKPNTNTFFEQMVKVTSYPIHFYNQKKQQSFYTLNNNYQAKISDKAVTEVLAGHIYQSKSKENDTYLGFPITIEGKPAAVFLQFSTENDKIFNSLLIFIILSTLIIGSIMILIAVHFLIRPLRNLKVATETIAGGNFDVSLDLKRQDEIGELAKSFNQMTEELKQIEEMRQDFVSNVSHEIQSPLTSISGFAKALKNENLISDEQRPYYLDIIISESERLSRLGDNLLKLASLDSEHHPFHLESFDLVEQIRQVILTLEPQWEQKQITIALEAERSIFIKGDYDLLQQVWLNLMSNSIKFTPENGKISIEVTQQDLTMITFSDSGIGMSKEETKKVFQRFYKSDKSRNSKQHGNGLGLAIVKKIIDLHQGSIFLKSEVNQGTKITIILPN